MTNKQIHGTLTPEGKDSFGKYHVDIQRYTCGGLIPFQIWYVTPDLTQ